MNTPATLFQALAGLPSLAALLLKLTLLLSGAWLAHAALAPCNPRWRVLLWRVALIGLLALPPAEGLLPKLRLALAPAAAPVAAAPRFPEPPPMPDIRSSAPRGTEPAPVPHSRQAAIPPQFSLFSWIRAHVPALVLVVWALVALVLALRLLAALGRLRRLIRSTQPAPEWAQRIAGRVVVDLHYPPGAADLRATRGAISPFAAGVRRPVVVLPDAILTEAQAGALPAILAHELAHLRAGDIAWMMLARWVSVLLWFHPLAWRLRRAHDAACEAVCDAVAAEAAGGAQAYSRTLAATFLELMIDSPVPLGAPMFRTSEITRRIRQIRRGIRAGALARGRVLTLLVLSAALMVCLGGLKVVRAEPAQAGTSGGGSKPLITETVITSPNPHNPKPVSTPVAMAPASDQSDMPAATASSRVEGQVYDPGVKPIAGATVMIREVGKPGQREIMAPNIKTDDRGRYRYNEIKWPYRMYAELREDLPSTGGLRYQMVRLGKIFTGNQTIDLRFKDFPAGKAVFAGQVTESDGKPIRKYTIKIEDQYDANDYSQPEFHVFGYEKTFTAEDGRFTFAALPEGAYTMIVIPAEERPAYDTHWKTVQVKGARTEVTLSIPRKQAFWGRVVLTGGGVLGSDQKMEIGLHKNDEAMFSSIGDVDPNGYFVVSCNSIEHEHLKTGQAWLSLSITDRATGNGRQLLVIPFAKLGASRGQAGIFTIGDLTGPKGDAPSTGERVLHFPADRSLGQLQVRDKGVARDDWQSTWTAWEAAKGDVKIPAGVDVALLVDEAGGQDLAPLDKLGADDLQLLDISSKFVLDMDLKHLKGLTGLKSLSLEGCDLDGSGFGQLRGLKGLEELLLGGLKIKDESLGVLAGIKSLRILSLEGTRISDAGLKRLRPLKDLAYLSLSNTLITDQGLETVKGFTKLVNLQLDHTKITDRGLASLAGLRELRELNLSFNRLGDAGVEWLKGLTQLNSLLIHRTAITDEGLKTIAGLKGLTLLTLDEQKITDTGLANLKGLDSLFSLNIGGIGDTGVATLGALPGLGDLYLSESRVTTASLKSFGKMKGLKQLYVSSGGIDADFIERLRAALPGCKVVFQGPTAPTRVQQQNPQWATKFYEVYQLKDGEVLKRIAPPFIPERMNYYRVEDSGQAEAIPRGPDEFTFHWDNKLQHWGDSFGTEGELSHLLNHVLGLPRYAFEGDPALLKLKTPGDWIVRTNASERTGTPMPQLIAALEKIVNAQTSQSIHIERRRVERDVIVVRGSYAPHPVENYGTRSEIQIYVDKLNDDPHTGGGGSGPLKEFIEWVGSRERCFMIDETASSAVQVSWHDNNDSSPVGDQSLAPDKLDRLLKNLARQTGLEFKPERRTVEVWVVTNLKLTLSPME